MRHCCPSFTEKESKELHTISGCYIPPNKIQRIVISIRENIRYIIFRVDMWFW